MRERTEAGHEMVDHPADLRFRIWAPDHEALFREAGRTLIETLFPEATGDSDPESTFVQEIEIRLDGVDPDDLLVRWLGELLFLAETRRLVPRAIRFDELNGGKLRASCTMHKAGTPGCEIKAVTYHQSGIRNTGNGLEATLLFDV